MRVRYTPRARDDLAGIYTYLTSVRPRARSVKIAIERRIRLLADFPLIAPMTDDPGVYELSMIRHPTRYIIVWKPMRCGLFTSDMPRASDLSPMNSDH